MVVRPSHSRPTSKLGCLKLCLVASCFKLCKSRSLGLALLALSCDTLWVHNRSNRRNVTPAGRACPRSLHPHSRAVCGCPGADPRLRGAPEDRHWRVQLQGADDRHAHCPASQECDGIGRTGVKWHRQTWGGTEGIKGTERHLHNQGMVALAERV